MINSMKDSSIINGKYTNPVLKEWRGVGDSERNAHKVRSGKLREYLEKLTPKTLQYCLENANYHLPPELKYRYYSDLKASMLQGDYADGNETFLS